MPPRAELHLHLDGSVEPETLLEIDPTLTREEIAANTAYSDFAGFLKSFVWVNKRLRTPDHYARVARRNCLSVCMAEGVVYAEVILSVGVVLWKEQDLDAIFQALSREAARTPVTVRWIFDAIRQFGAEIAKPVFDLAAERLGDGVIAIGLGGDEERWPREIVRRSLSRGARSGLALDLPRRGNGGAVERMGGA